MALPIPPPDKVPVVENWRPITTKGRTTLRGFARVRFPSGIILDEVAIHCTEDGMRWVSPPARPMIDKQTGTVLRDSVTQKIRYQPLIAFTTNGVRHQWGQQVLAALLAKHPDAIV